MATKTLERSSLTHIGEYQIDGIRGEGGMGIVYAGYDRLRDRVAIKVLNKQLASDPFFRKKFLEEGQKQRELSKHSNNVLAIYTCECEDDMPFLVMEYADGGSLRDRMERKPPLTTEESVEIVRCIAEAVKKPEGLSEPIVHLDIKPENILFVQGRPKLADFGIARRLRTGQDGNENKTLIGFDPDYAPPEQVMGQAEAKSDIFALGMVLFRLLAGDKWERFVAHDEDAHREIASRLPREARKYAKIIADCLQFNPADRPDAGALVAELERLSGSGKPQSPPVLLLLLSVVAAIAIAPVLWSAVPTFLRIIFPPDTQLVSFAPMPSEVELWIAGERQNGVLVELPNGTHEVAIVAPGYVGDLLQVDVPVAEEALPIPISLQADPATADFEYLFFRSFWLDAGDSASAQRLLATSWTDPVLARSSELLRFALSDLEQLVEARRSLETLARAGDSYAVSTLVLAARGRLPALGLDISIWTERLETAAESGHLLANILLAERIIAELESGSIDAAARDGARTKAIAALRRAARGGMSHTAERIAEEAGLTIT